MRKDIALLFFVGLMQFQVLAAGDDLKCPGCNVVMLDFDLLRSDYINQGNLNSVVPNINKFFKNSIKFKDVSAGSGVTAISNTSTLTARDSIFTYALLRNTYEDMPPQIPLRHKLLFQDTPTIIEKLKTNGYYTMNANHGWYAGRQMLLDRGVDKYVGLGEVYKPENTPAKIMSIAADMLPDMTSIDAPSNPFVLLMRSEDLRALPYRFPIDRKHLKHPKIKYIKSADSDFYEIRFQLNKKGEIRQEYSSFEKSDWMTNQQVREYNKLSKMLYSQQLRYVDQMVGQIFVSLQKKKLLDKTIVIFYSNHGDGLYDNKIPNHGVSYQSCVSVPLMIRHPKVKKSIVINTPVALLDLSPTILDFLNVKSDAKSDGVSLIPTIENNRYHSDWFFGVDKESKYVRYKNFKLIIWPDRKRELFDLNADKGELIDLSAKLPDVVRSLEDKFNDHETEQLELAYELLEKFKIH